MVGTVRLEDEHLRGGERGSPQILNKLTKKLHSLSLPYEHTTEVRAHKYPLAITIQYSQYVHM